MKGIVYMSLAQMATNSTHVFSILHTRHCLLSAVTRQVMYVHCFFGNVQQIIFTYHLAAYFCDVYLSPVEKKKYGARD